MVKRNLVDISKYPYDLVHMVDLVDMVLKKKLHLLIGIPNMFIMVDASEIRRSTVEVGSLCQY